MSNRVLIVIDPQNDFITGALGSEAANAAVPKIHDLLIDFTEHDEKIIFTMDTHYHHNYLYSQEGQKLPIKHCIYKTHGWEIDDRIDFTHFYDNSAIVMKSQFGFTKWDLYKLDQYDEIIVCGFCSSICCMANIQIIHALYPEIPIKFVENASAGLSPEDHAAACQIMKDCQIEVVSL